uniref:RRM domain-containing protein n=1 Tax=Meleagris gallopavo TaxID=9103 RepID=A0A803Y2H8_MELGA
MPEDDQRATRNLFIGNLDHNVSEVELRRAFEKYGIIEEVVIKRPARGQGGAYAFLKFQNLDMAHRAKVAMSGLVSKALFTDGFLNLCAILVLRAQEGCCPVLPTDGGPAHALSFQPSPPQCLSGVLPGGRGRGIVPIVPYGRLRGWSCFFVFVLLVFYLANLNLRAFQGQAGCGSGQPGLVVGNPAHSRGLKLD